MSVPVLKVILWMVIDFILRPRLSDTIKEEVVIKPSVKKDTTYMVVHEVVQELVTITEDSYAIQHGAFKIKSNAEKTRKNLEKVIGKKVDIVVEDGYYKVRIPDIKTREEVDNYLKVLREAGITEVWVISLKAKKQQIVLTEKQDTIRNINESLLTMPELIGDQKITVQLGAFRNRSNAMELLKHLKARYGNRIKMVFEAGFYKLRLSGMTGMKKTVLDELNRLGPDLEHLKFKDVWMSPPVTAAEEIPEEAGVEEPAEELVEKPVEPVRPVISVGKALKVFEMPAFEKPRLKMDLIPGKLSRPKTSAALTISIQVAVFDKKSDASKAVRKISSKLHLNVEIVEKWNRYFVVIRGFHTREETYPYYPELAGLGYPGVSLIEE